MKKCLLLLSIALIINSCKSTSELKTIGSIEKSDDALDDVLAADAKIEILGEGYQWSEGPVWVEAEQMLLFSDVPKNIIYKWTESKGVETFLTPSGYTGTEPSESREPGSNGLTLDQAGRLILCQHGDRRVARLDSDFKSPTPVFSTIADRYQGKRFNSPTMSLCEKMETCFLLILHTGCRSRKTIQQGRSHSRACTELTVPARFFW
jgi:gluconolactonase